MPSLQEWEINKIMIPVQAIQSKSFAFLMWLLGQTCSGEGMVPAFALLYWLWDQDKCIYGIWLVPVSEIVNGLLKWFFRSPRPGWSSPKVKLIAWSNEYSFPSSHSQIIWALCTFFASTSEGSLRKRLWHFDTSHEHWTLGFALASYAFASLVSVSRIYEGVHYPRDVVAGALIGSGMARLWTYVLPDFKHFVATEHWSLLAQFGLLQAVALSFGVAVWLAHSTGLGRADPHQLMQWIKTAGMSNDKKHFGRHIDPVGVPAASYSGMVGVLVGLGFAVPLRFKWRRFVEIALPEGIVACLLRTFVGLVIVMGVYMMLRVVEKKAFTPSSAGAAFFRFLRYCSVPLDILLTAPLLFNFLAI